MSRRLELFLLAAILALGAAARWPLLTDASFPVSTHVDERLGQRLLHQFDARGDLNPRFLHYPTLSFHAAYFALKAAGSAPEDYLWRTRLLNWLFATLLAAAAWFLARELAGGEGSAASAAGLFAALATSISPTVARTASQYNPDIPLALMATLSLAGGTRWLSGRGGEGSWRLATASLGAALACKYSAVALIPAWFAASAFGRRGDATDTRADATEFAGASVPWLDRPLPRYLPAALFAAGALGALAFRFHLTEDLFLRLVRAGGEKNAVVDDADLRFLAYVHGKAVAAAVAGFAMALALAFWRPLANAFRRRRPWVAAIAVGTLFLLLAPYVWLDWKRFLYDFGSELKVSALADQPTQFAFYLGELGRMESAAALGLAVLGTAALAASRDSGRRALYALLGALLYFVAIGAARRGFGRYLTLPLPTVFALAGAGLAVLAERVAAASDARAGRDGREDFDEQPLAVGRILALAWLIAASLVAASNGPALAALDAQGEAISPFRQSRDAIARLRPERALRAGYAPDVELELAGIATTEVSRASLASPNLLDRLGAGDLLSLDGASLARLSPENRAALELVWGTDEHVGQWLFRKVVASAE